MELNLPGHWLQDGTPHFSHLFDGFIV